MGVHNFVLGRAAHIRYALPVACTATPANLKTEVAQFWNAAPCGSRYLGGARDFEAHSRARYALEPYIPRFAKFSESRGKRILEIGVGMGSDYLEWLKAGAEATGIDISEASINRARERCERHGLRADLRVADAEDLPFADASFDIAVAMFVMSVVPDPQRVLDQMRRVVKRGGRIVTVNHFRAEAGFRRGIERWLAQYGGKLGWHPEFAIEGVLGQPGLRLAERRTLPPVGLYTLLVFERT